MTITYAKGNAVEAVLLTRTGDMIRAIIQGAEDVTELRNVNGTWVSDDCEPVRIAFAWEKRDQRPPVTEADCYCSRELADRLISLLYTDSRVGETTASLPFLPGAESEKRNTRFSSALC
jgi:hypothetical protein